MAKRRDAPTDGTVDIEVRVAELYGGPLASFVAQRDALARTLRSEGRREEATRVKALKKPKALAWALDAGGRADPTAVAELGSAVDSVTEAQAGGGDVRAALARLRAAEAALIAAAGDAAERHDHAVDRTALSSALRAVVGDPDSMAALVTGRLVDTSGAGGMGVVSPGGTPADRSSRPAKVRAAKAGGAEPTGDDHAATAVDAAVIATARRALAAAERAARAAADAARGASATADAADIAAHRAEDDAASARRRADEALDAARRARSEAVTLATERDDAASRLDAAQDALRELER